MFGKQGINVKEMGKILNDWVYKSVKQIFFNERELARCGLKKIDDVFYELNSAFSFIVIDSVTKAGFYRKQNIIDEMHNQNIEMLINSKYIASDETIDYRRCLSQTYKENYKIMKKDEWMKELARAILERTEGQYEDEKAVSIFESNLVEFCKNTIELLKKHREK
ncbi:MAG: hypothetical protein ABRQ26_09085 [Syntrophomonadaceae bacterium]